MGHTKTLLLRKNEREYTWSTGRSEFNQEVSFTNNLTIFFHFLFQIASVNLGVYLKSAWLHMFFCPVWLLCIKTQRSQISALNPGSTMLLLLIGMLDKITKTSCNNLELSFLWWVALKPVCEYFLCLSVTFHFIILSYAPWHGTWKEVKTFISIADTIRLKTCSVALLTIPWLSRLDLWHIILFLWDGQFCPLTAIL